MGEMAGRVVGESPLVPNRKMQRMYEGMVESRLLEELVARRRKKAKKPAAHGQEACRVSVLIDLEPNDLTSDIAGSVTTAFLRGAELRHVVEHAEAGKKHLATPGIDGLLPEVKDTRDRFANALGAAVALKRLKLRHVVVVFAEADTVKPSLWRETLRFALREELPMLFVALAGKGHKAFELSGRAKKLGLPGIPVDASDAVALYRVAQESIGRSRAGGGPALMECVRLFVEGEKKQEANPLDAMRQTLLSRKVCGEDWIDGVSPAFQGRLEAL